jgi:esterase/lipase superfamily enzyme
VFYGTDRRPTGQSAPASFFGGLRGDATPHLGICHVSIPPSHEVGRIETPFIASVPLLGAYAREDPARHVVITGLTHLSRADFGHHLRQRLQVTSGDAFVFVHGYNNTFADACKRTAQIAHDLEFRGVPVMYSWPSGGKATAYAGDDGNADWSLPHFEAFLTMIQRDTGARHVHLVAHSTGSRLLARALHALARTTAWGPGAFHQVVLAAADVDAAEFRDQYAPSIRALASRLTLYVSSADKALLAATRLRKYPRAGEAGER